MEMGDGDCIAVPREQLPFHRPLGCREKRRRSIVTFLALLVRCRCHRIRIPTMSKLWLGLEAGHGRTSLTLGSGFWN